MIDMSLPRLDHATRISDQLNELAAMVKTRSRASLTDANRVLETVATRFFNALFGWHLVNLNTKQANYPAADLGDRQRRIAIQVTNESGSDKIKHTTFKAAEYGLDKDFDRLIVFFLLPKKPGFPKNFTQPASCPKIETWDLADLLKLLQDLHDLKALALAAKVLDEEMGRLSAPVSASTFDISRILKYAPSDLIGRKAEAKLLNDAWAKVRKGTKKHSRVLTFVALGGEGKTSLVAKWAAELAAQDWPGCDAAFAWSFYSQGTREQLAASSDLFLREACTFFGDDADKAFAASPAGAFEKGQRLARLVGQRRSLLILDGLEPLQYAPTAPTPGQLKDQGIAALLKGLAAASHGLCVVTTRYSLPDLKTFWQTTAPEQPLVRLSKEAGVHLLQQLGVRKESGSKADFEKLVEDVKGHALTLTLLGGFLKRAFHGDIRQRDRVKFEKADEKMDGGHAFRTMAAYEQWLLRDGGDEGRREVAVLWLMGLFDRPADAGCLNALLQRPVIEGLTEPLMEVAEDDWNFSLESLASAKLLTVSSETLSLRTSHFPLPTSLDAHPHLREYFSKQLREKNPDAWRAAHRRLYEHLCATTKEGDQPTLEDLQPLCEAVSHGCNGDLQEEACAQVYSKRILRGDEAYIIHQLGSVGSTLGVLVGFFETPWDKASSRLPAFWQHEILNDTAYCLRAAGRLIESTQPISSCFEACVASKNFQQAAISGNNLADLCVTLGELPKARKECERGVTNAEQSGDLFQQSINSASLGTVLHQQGRLAEALQAFCKAEGLRQRHSPQTPLLKSLRGFQYSDLLLTKSEIGAWRQFLAHRPLASASALEVSVTADLLRLCDEVEQRSRGILERIEAGLWPIDAALEHLTLGRIALYRTVLGIRESTGPVIDEQSHCSLAMSGLRRTGDATYIPFGLLTRAWLRFLIGARTDSDSAQADLDEAWEIAERGPMKLFLADIHLHRARLFFREKEYPKAWISPQADLAAAEKLINACGYHRRDEELADAKRAILG
jgi:tetratricopeptide (TPR) repeat protein